MHQQGFKIYLRLHNFPNPPNREDILMLPQQHQETVEVKQFLMYKSVVEENDTMFIVGANQELSLPYGSEN